MSKWSSAYRDSRWQKMRLKVMERDGFACQSCGKDGPDAALAVHHTYYEAGTAPWEYPLDSLITWCEDCHDGRHILGRCVSKALAGMELRYAKKVAAMFARESSNLALLAECESAGIPCGEIENVLKFALNTRGAK